MLSSPMPKAMRLPANSSVARANRGVVTELHQVPARNLSDRVEYTALDLYVSLPNPAATARLETSTALAAASHGPARPASARSVRACSAHRRRVARTCDRRRPRTAASAGHHRHLAPAAPWHAGRDMRRS